MKYKIGEVVEFDGVKAEIWDIRYDTSPSSNREISFIEIKFLENGTIFQGKAISMIVRKGNHHDYSKSLIDKYLSKNNTNSVRRLR